MKRLCLLILVLAGIASGLAQSADDQYVRIYTLVQEADSLNNASQLPTALAKYQEAQAALVRFQKAFPDWNANIVKFRLSYIASQIAEISPKANTAPPTTTTTPPASAAPKVSPAPVVTEPAKPSPEAQLRNQLAALNEQVRQLQSDKTLLEAKLKEALSVQPAAVDPREVARAGEQVKTLQKENDLLKVRLAQEQARTGTGDAKALEQAKKDLAEANQHLAAQNEKTNALEAERKALESRLNSLTPGGSNTNTEAINKQLTETNRQLEANKEVIAHLTTERQALQDQLKAADPKAAAALREENNVLKKELADLKRRKPAKSGDLGTAVPEAQAQIAALQSEKELLRLEKVALENRVKQLQGSAPAVASATPTAATSPDQSRRIQELEHERDLLQQKLDAISKTAVVSRPKKEGPPQRDADTELTSLRLRLEVLEARRVPFTPEELALLKQPQLVLAEFTNAPAKRTVTEMPPGSTLLVADARRYFASKQYDRAEQTFLEVLRKDEKNALTLANLAAVQMELNHLDDAEKNATQAVRQAPDDPLTLSVLGQVRFRQKKYDEAFTALSRAANLDPQNAEVQNFLGLVLSEKGLRVPAETALRKAIQLRPAYGDAHNNLAVIYLTQTPPAIELARWHYQRGVAAGSRNPDLEKLLEEKEKTLSAK